MNKRYRLIILLLCVLWKLSAAGSGESSSNETIIPSASLFPEQTFGETKSDTVDFQIVDQPITPTDTVKTPTPLHIPAEPLIRPTYSVTMTEATTWNYRSLGDLLDRLPGFWVRDLGVTGQHAPFRYTGANPNQSVVLLDGEPIGDAWTGEVDLNGVPVESIQNIELYPDINPFGLNPIGAVVNLVTKQPEPKRPTTTFMYRAAGNGFNDLDIQFSQKFFRGLTFSAGYSSLKFAEGFSGLAFSGSQVRFDTRFNWSETLRFRYGYQSRTHEGETPYAIHLPDRSGSMLFPDRKIKDGNHRFTTHYRFGSIENTFFYHLNTYQYEYRKESPSGFLQVPVKKHSMHFRQRLSRAGLPLTWGIRVSRDHLDQDSLQVTDRSQESLYLLSAVSLTDKIRLAGTVNTLHFSDMNLQLEGAFSGSYLVSNTFQLGLAINRSLRFPTIGEHSGFLLRPGPQETLADAVLETLEHQPVPNSDLTPEVASSMGLFLNWNPDKTLNTKTRLFYRTSDKLIGLFRSEENYRFTNAGKANFYGLESTIELGPVRHITLKAIVNYLSALDQYDNVLLERPNVWGAAAVCWTGSFFEEDLFVNLEVSSHYRSQFWTAVDDQLFLTGLAGQILQAKATLTVMKHADIFLAFDNLLNSDLHKVYGFPVVGRTFRYGIRWTVFD